MHKIVKSILNKMLWLNIVIFPIMVLSFTSFAQSIKNNDAEIVNKPGSYWVIKNGDITIENSVSGATSFDNLKVRTGSTLNVDSQTGIIVQNALTLEGNLVLQGDANGTAGVLTNGTVTQSANTTTSERYMTGGKWHLVSSPVVGQEISGLLVNLSNNIAKSGLSYAMMEYSETENNWDSYFTASTEGDLTSGKGYAVQRTSHGDVDFVGTIANSNVSVPVTQNGEGWMLVGNPYPTAIGVTINANSVDNFITSNVNNLDPSFVALYLWDEGDAYDGNRSDYKIINNAGLGSLVQDYIQQGQGFLVKSATGASTVDFTLNMRSIQPTEAFKAAKVPWPSFNLIAETDGDESSTTVTFNHQMTKGLDETFDAGMFKNNPDFALYTHLVEDNGVDFAIQCLPDFEFDKLVIPVGLDAASGKYITFSAETNNLSSECSIYLEDRQEKTITDLSDGNKSYSIKLDTNSMGTGRFFIHTSDATINQELITDTKYQVIPQKALKKIMINGLVEEPTTIFIYDVKGRLIMKDDLQFLERNMVSFYEANNGIYLVQIQNSKGITSEKIAW